MVILFSGSRYTENTVTWKDVKSNLASIEKLCDQLRDEVLMTQVVIEQLESEEVEVSMFFIIIVTIVIFK